MKLSQKVFVGPLLAALLIAVCPAQANSAGTTPESSDHLTNADLDHLLSLLDSNEATGKPEQSSGITHTLLSDSGANETPSVVQVTSEAPKTTTHAVTLKKRIKIRKPKTTTTPIPTTTPWAPQVYSPVPNEVIWTSTPPMITRREDANMEHLKTIAQPSQQELVQQLSLLNSLLSSLGENSTTTPEPTSTSKKAEQQLSPSIVIAPQSKVNISSSPNLQAIALLNSILTAGADVDANAATALLGLGALGPSSVATRQTGSDAGDTEATAALNDFLRQSALIEAQRLSQGQGSTPLGNNNLNNVQNLQGNLQAATAASNQISSLLALLGSISPQSVQLLNNPQMLPQLLQYGQSNPSQMQQNALLASLLRNQNNQNKRQQSQSNSLADLFAQDQPQQSQSPSFNFGNLFSGQSQNQNSASPGLGIMSSIGSLGSSIISTVSNVFTGSGFGGKPRVRGVDTRVGLGYRFGDAADAQFMWDVGPQLFTDPLRNEAKTPTAKPKDQQLDPYGQLASTQIRAEDLQQDISAVKRQLQLQMQQEMQNQPSSKRSLISGAAPRKKPLSLVDIWNSGKEMISSVKEPIPEIPFQLLTPPMALDAADEFQISRNKIFKKRSSASLKPYYSKPADDPLSGHSTLTTYEKMLLKHGDDFGDVDGQKSHGHNTPTYQRRPRPRPHNGSYKDKMQESEYGVVSTPSPRKKFRTTSRPNQSPAKRPIKNRRRRPQANKWRANKQESRDKERDQSRKVPKFPDDEQEKNKYKSGTNDREYLYEDENRKKPQIHKDHDAYYAENRPRPDSRPPDDFNYNPHEKPSYENSKYRPQSRPEHYFNYNPYDEKNHNDQRPDSHSRPNYALDSPQEEYNSEDQRRPKPSGTRPNKNHSTRDHRRRQQPGLMTKIFSAFWGNRGSRRRSPNRRDTNDYQRYTYKNPVFRMSKYDRFHSRNKEPVTDPMASFRRKSNRVQIKGGIPYDFYQSHSFPEVNPEANDSFLRRNAVAVNTKLREAEKQKLLNEKSFQDPKDSDSDDDPESEQLSPPSQTKSVMSFVRNYLSSKTPSKSTNKTVNSISTLTQLLSNPSALNPLKILPIRRRKRPQNPKSKTKLMVIDGKPQIVNSTSEPDTSKEEPKPIVHIGEDMSFEELTKVFGLNKNGTKKGKKKLTIKLKKKPDPRKDTEDDFDDEDLAEERVDKDKKAKDEVEESGEVDENDGLKGIFIDIESGEVNVLKPVASLTSFEPKKEETEEEVDEYEDEDGDGIADADMKRKQDIFTDIQKELKRNFNKMKKAKERAEAKQKRKEELESKGLDESMDVVSKYFDMVTPDSDKGVKSKSTLQI